VASPRPFLHYSHSTPFILSISTQYSTGISQGWSGAFTRHYYVQRRETCVLSVTRERHVRTETRTRRTHVQRFAKQRQLRLTKATLGGMYDNDVCSLIVEEVFSPSSSR